MIICLNDRRIISIHAPRTGSDGTSAERLCGHDYFNPRSPHGERQNNGRQCFLRHHFNPRSPHGERRYSFLAARRHSSISIHAPRTGSDPTKCTRCEECQISIHAPRTGSDLAGKRGEETSILFQSTLPARGATERPRAADAHGSHFNPRSPHGERRHSKRTNL